MLLIAKVIFARQGMGNVCYVNTALNGVFPTDDVTAAVVYVPGLTIPLPTRTPVLSGEVTNTYVGLVPGSRPAVQLLMRNNSDVNPNWTCQATMETLTVLTY
ncbi:MAG: hypothetical protein JWO71_1094 [Candidatus Acidoferrum typicum]|nr:hypothetical protein [Candidatus Acidoferrum typicum]